MERYVVYFETFRPGLMDKATFPDTVSHERIFYYTVCLVLARFTARYSTRFHLHTCDMNTRHFSHLG